MTSPRLRQLARWGAASAYMALIFRLSSRTHHLSVDLFPHWDKVVHFMEYGVLAVLLFGALGSTFPRWTRLRVARAAVIMATFYGLSDEFHQSFVPGREASGVDLLADFTGASLSVMALAYRGKLRSGLLSSGKV